MSRVGVKPITPIQLQPVNIQALNACILDFRTVLLSKSVCLSARPSVCPSNACIVIKRKKTSAHMFTPSIDHHIFKICFRQEEWLMGATRCT